MTISNGISWIKTNSHQVENERKKKTSIPAAVPVEEDLDMFSDGGDKSPFIDDSDDDYDDSGSLGLPSSPSIEGLDSDVSPTPELIKWDE